MESLCRYNRTTGQPRGSDPRFDQPHGILKLDVRWMCFTCASLFLAEQWDQGNLSLKTYRPKSLPFADIFMEKNLTTSVELICLPGSPWTAKAVWMLHHCGISFQRRPFEPMVDEIWLRYKLGLWPWHGRFWGRLTVPIAILKDDSKPSRVLSDSFDIAEWAMSTSSKTVEVSKLRPWNALSDVLLEYGRAVFVKVATTDVRAAIEVLSPPWMKKLPTFLVGIIMKVAVRVFAFKYRHENLQSSSSLALEAIQKLRAALRSGKGQYLVGDQFSYADIVMAIAVNGLSPSEDVFQFTVPRKYDSEISNFLKDFEDVKEWKNAVIKQHLPQMLRKSA